MFVCNNIVKLRLRKPLGVRYFRWGFGKNSIPASTAVDAMKTAYRQMLLPLEEETYYHKFHSLKLNDADFEASASILLIGQYSTGKTTMIRHMLQRDYPGIRIGPEPTTDRFITISYDEKEKVIPGNALVSDKTKPYGHLATYGNAFLTKLQCSTVPSPILQGITIIDTPGILSGEKQRVDRGYDFPGVLEWFGERVDRIILLFDANKLDISDEFRCAIEALKGNEEKIHILLNKADAVDQGSLMRVYGSLLWSLGKVFNTPEVMKVFIGSFWDKPLVNKEFRTLFEQEERALLKDIQSLPTASVLRKLNDLSKRARHVLVHASIMDAFASKMPAMFGKDFTKNKLIDELPLIYKEIQTELTYSVAEMPDRKKMQQVFSDLDSSKIKRPNKKLVDNVKKMLDEEITQIMSMIETGSTELSDGVFKRMSDASTPFAFNAGVGFDDGKLESGWIVDKHRSEADAFFDQHCSVDGKLPRAEVRQDFIKTGLPNDVLGDIYSLADADGDGLLNRNEFALARYIIRLKLKGFDLPRGLPEHLIPPSVAKGTNLW